MRSLVPVSTVGVCLLQPALLTKMAMPSMCRGRVHSCLTHHADLGHKGSVCYTCNHGNCVRNFDS